MKAQPDFVVTEWLDQQGSTALGTTSVNVFKVHLGLACMKLGRRRSALIGAFSFMPLEDLGGAGLEPDDRSAEIAVERGAVGKQVDFRDTAIDAMTVSYNATFVTRNLQCFTGLTIPVISPWCAR